MSRDWNWIYFMQAASKVKGCGEKKVCLETSLSSTNFLYDPYSILKFNYREKLFFEKFFRDDSFPRKLDPLFWIFSRTENETLENWESLKFLFRFLKISSSRRQNFPLQSFKNSKLSKETRKSFDFQDFIKFYIRAECLTLKIQRDWKSSGAQIFPKSTYLPSPLN